MNLAPLRVLPVALLAALLPFVAGCGRPPPRPVLPSRPVLPPRPVRIAPVEQRDTPRYVDSIGHCVALYAVSIVAQVSGQITATHFQQGQEVTAGAPLFTIDPRPYQAALVRAQADLAAHQAQLKSKDAQLRRSRDLLPGHYISPQDFESLSGDVDALKAQVMADQAAIDAARINLDFCTVRAPVAGRVGVLRVDQGNVVSAGAGQSLVTLNTLDPIYVDFPIIERDLAEVKRLADKTRLKVNVLTLGPAAASREGELLVIDNTVQSGAGTVKLRAIVPNPDRGLWPEQFVNVRLLLETQAGALLVPAEAVKVGQMGSFVFVVAPDMTLDLRPVRVGQTHGDRVVVLEGLKLGERVVVGGQMMLAPGIQVIEAPPPDAAPAAAKKIGPPKS
ncbi:MAG: efflux RND transporter periplasmic adaptor subunit [Verrucomicrobiae bacterium]|nr:efflux RND transporter periplasmic adaptor subunit [Verrucomicrobiae bacterium]